MSSFFSSRHLGRLSSVGVLALLLIAGCGDDGADGQTPLIESQDASEEQCPAGGTVVMTGLDTDGDGSINTDHESYSETVFCDGPQGEAGQPGDPGTDGEDGERIGLIETTAEDPGENCEVGGIRVQTGFDTTDDGEIDDVLDTHYVCSAPSCTSGEPLDFEVDDSDLPDELIVGMGYELDVTTSATDLDVDVLNAGVGNVDVSADYNADDETVTLTANSGTDITDLALLATDGCDIGTANVRFGPFDEGLVDLHVAHLFPGAGDVEIFVSGEDEPLVDIDELDVISSFNAVEVPWGTYDLDVVDEDGDIIATFEDIELEPLNTYMAYAYSDDGDLALGLMQSDVEDPEDDDFRARAIHTADDGPDVDIYAIDPQTGDETLLFDELSFGDFTDQVDLPATDAYLGVDVSGDGVVDVTYSTTFELFEEGTNFEIFAYFDDDDLWLLTFDYDATTLNSVNLHDPNELATSDLHLAHLFPGAGDVELFVSGADYDDDDPIADVDELDVISDFNRVEVDEGTYDFDLVTTDGDFITTFEDVTIEPFARYMAYVYNDGDGPALGLMNVNAEEPEDDQTRIRATHLATNGPDVGIYAVDEGGDTTLLAEDLAFESSTDQVDLDEFEDSFIGVDLTGDGVVDAEFESTEGLFEGETNFEIFAYFNQGNLWLLTFDYEAFTASSVNLHSSVEFSDLYAGHFFEGGGTVRAFASGDDPAFANPIFEIDEISADGPFDIGVADQELDFYDADGNSLGSTDVFTVDDESADTVVFYDDGDGLAVEVLNVDTSEVDDGDFRIRAHHFADDAGTVDLYADDDGDLSLLIDDFQFLDTAGPATFGANADATLGIDVTQDGDIDLSYLTTVGAFSDGANLEAVAFNNGGDVFVGTIDYASGSTAIHDPEVIFAGESPDLEIADGDDFSRTVTVSDCDTVSDISLDLDLDYGFPTIWLTLLLEAPDGTEIVVWAEGAATSNGGEIISAVDGGIFGNFNNDFAPDGTDAVPVSDLAGVSGNGDWTLTGENRSSTRGGNLNSWGLILSCD